MVMVNLNIAHDVDFIFVLMERIDLINLPFVCDQDFKKLIEKSIFRFNFFHD